MRVEVPWQALQIYSNANKQASLQWYSLRMCQQPRVPAWCCFTLSRHGSWGQQPNSCLWLLAREAAICRRGRGLASAQSACRERHICTDRGLASAQSACRERHICTDRGLASAQSACRERHICTDKALLQPSQHAESSTSAQTEAQSVNAGASTVAAANEKRSHRHNLVAFMSLHVASRLLRVMHRHRQPMKPFASSQVVPGRAASKLANAKTSSTCREQQQHWGVMSETAGPGRSAAPGGTQSTSEPQLPGEASRAVNAAAATVYPCDGEAMPSQDGVVPTRACMAGTRVPGVAATLHQLTLATKVTQLEMDKQRLQGQLWEAISVAKSNGETFKRVHQKAVKQQSMIATLNGRLKSAYDQYERQQDNFKRFLDELEGVHQQWDKDVLDFARKVFELVTPAAEVRCPKDMEALVWQDVQEIISLRSSQESRAYLRKLLSTWHEDKNRQALKGTHKVISQILIEGMKQC
ncbi:TPA: hypothetical protein ACH3X3_014617 [Trebouxia sp. C0006]